jgi:hypothetical protein
MFAQYGSAPEAFNDYGASTLPANSGSHGLFPQFQGRTLRSLLTDLHDLVPDDRRDRIKEAIDATLTWEATQTIPADTVAVRQYFNLLNRSWGPRP